ncbi:hypothetical protein A8M32_01880 [Sinorhizobium alkalisoli]|uniref:Uncharacterized protein n=1 Tax=Sinorhizobium alkalisoli TaxID=1752398 RepID=A0A1E3VIN8_9HYPH|nr:hypothetical protein A8M32_01880 [Sinorhizobium alkalisoli]
MAGIAITRMDLTAAQVRAAAAKMRDARGARRMLAIAVVLEGVDRKTAAETCGLGSPDAARLGPSLQCGRAERAFQP